MVPVAPNFNFRVFFAPTAADRSLTAGDAGAAAAGASQSLLGSQASPIGFAEVSGLHAELEVEEHREGGFNSTPRKFPRWGRYPTLVFRRGVTTATDLWDWWAEVVSKSYTLSGTTKAPPRRNGVILLEDNAHVPVAGWFFLNALPERLVGPGLQARGSDIAIETLELSHEGLVRLPKNTLPQK
jgi:phage tail-like protein